MYQPKDEQAIATLYENVFNLPMPMEYWRWRYCNNPTNDIFLQLAVTADNQIVGQYAVMPLIMKIGDKEIEAALSLDSMVHADYRGQGMFSKLGKDLYDNLIAEGKIQFVYGFPNSEAYPPRIKHLGWVDLCENMPIYIRPLNFTKILQKVVRSTLLAQSLAPLAALVYRLLYLGSVKSDDKYALYAIQKFDERFDTLWQAARDISPIMIRRDRMYLNWRYIDHPNKTYTILAADAGDMLAGYIVLTQREIKGLEGIFIADLLVHPQYPDVAKALINAATVEARKRKNDLVSCLMFPDIPYAASLKKCGYIMTPAQFLPQEIHLGARNLGSYFEDTFIQNGTNWYITWGDHDTI